MITVDYYFDFMSPYAYLACSQIPRLVSDHARRARFVGHSFDMWAARIAAGNTGPSNREIPAKGAVLMADVSRWAKHYGLAVKPPKSFDTSRFNRAFLIARRDGKEVEFLVNAFDLLWGQGGDPDDHALLVNAASRAGLNGPEMAREADSEGIIALYEAENRDAQARGIFGAPMFVAEGEMYWGNDRIEWLERQLLAAQENLESAR